MTPRCVNCLHWDEERADQDGRAPCAITRSAPEVPRPITIYVTGDYCCPMFAPKLVVKTPTTAVQRDR